MRWAVSRAFSVAAARVTASGVRRWVRSATLCAEAGVVAGIMIYSANCFGGIIASKGHDVHLLMQGIASDRGLLKLFGRLKKVQTAVRPASHSVRSPRHPPRPVAIMAMSTVQFCTALVIPSPSLVVPRCMLTGRH